MLRVPGELAGSRVDVFLRAILRSTSRTRAKAIAKVAAFDLQGRRLRPNQRVRAADWVVLWRVPMDEIDDDIELPELYRDEHLLVIDKPPQLTVHPTASHYHRTVIKLLEHRYPDQTFTLIHRLDQDTSGVLMLGLTPEADRAFKRLLEGTLTIPPGVDASVSKTYRAITWGVPEDGLINLPLEPDVTSTMRVKMRIAAPGTGLEAQTQVRVVARAADYALVECALFTGRQHQIRVHLAARGTPVVGDRLYGPNERLHARGADGLLTPEELDELEMPRQALHAFRYRLPHALSWRQLAFEAPLPADMRDFWLRIGGEPSENSSS